MIQQGTKGGELIKKLLKECAKIGQLKIGKMWKGDNDMPEEWTHFKETITDCTHTWNKTIRARKKGSG